MMQNFIPVEELQVRREKLLHLLPTNSLLILSAAQTKLRNSDVEYPFRQNSSFWYLSGIDEPDCVIVFIKNQNTKLETVLFIPDQQDATKAVWTGQNISIDKAAELSAVDTVYELSKLETILSDLFTPELHIYFEVTNLKLDEKIKTLLESNRQPKISESGKIIKKLRIEKSGWELDQLRQAAQINTLAFSKISQLITPDAGNSGVSKASPFFQDLAKPELWEYQIEAEILNTYKQHNLDWSYAPIVAAGKNATTLHYTKNNSRILDTDLILIDAGCDYNYYASDVTRTIPRQGKVGMSQAQKEIYDLVLKSQKAVLHALISTFGGSKQKILLENGVLEFRDTGDLSMQKLHSLSAEIISQGLLDLNLLSGSLEEIIETKSYAKYYMHSVSHWLGLDVHDLGGYTDDKGQAIKLQPGQVFTVEPGLYFPEDDESIPPELRGIGVRIEDDVAITNTGIEILTEGIEK